MSADIAAQLGEAASQLGARLGDPAIAHTVDEIEHITRGFSTTVAGIADGLSGITEWLRAAGHAGPLSGHASVVADRLAHVGNELDRLTHALGNADQRTH